MKKRVLALAAACLLGSFSAFAAPTGVDTTVKVGLYYGSGALDQATFSAVAPINAGGAVIPAWTFAYAKSTGGDGGELVTGDGTQLLTWQGGMVAHADNSIMTVNEKEYRGSIIFLAAEGKITVINQLSVDEYLYGVLPSETYTSWPAEALKAQAVVSRSYVLSSGRGRHSAQGFDVCNTTHCQVYSGNAKEAASTNAAVDATAGQVCTHGGKIVNTVFSASNGGYIEDSVNVWGGSTPYFVSKKDDYEKTEEIKGMVWDTTVTNDVIQSKLSASGVNIGAVKGLEILEKAASGRVTKLRIIGDSGEYIAERERCRTLLGLKSQLYTIESAGGGSPIIAASGDGTAIVTDFYVRAADTTAHLGNSIWALGGDGSKIQLSANASQAVWSNNGFVIHGRGNGHGIGMSQWGSEYMAEAGHSYLEILQYYYPGIAVETVNQ